MLEIYFKRFINKSLYARFIQIKFNAMKFRLRLVIFTFVNLCYLKKNNDEMFINYKEKRKIIERLLIKI